MLRKSWISETAYFVICTFLVFDLDFSGLISSSKQVLLYCGKDIA